MEDNKEKTDKLINGHRFIRNFTRGPREEIDDSNVELEWEDLNKVIKQLKSNREELAKEIEKNRDDNKKVMEIAEDMSLLSHYLNNCKIIKIGTNNLNKKYGFKIL